MPSTKTPLITFPVTTENGESFDNMDDLKEYIMNNLEEYGNDNYAPSLQDANENTLKLTFDVKISI